MSHHTGLTSFPSGLLQPSIFRARLVRWLWIAYVLGAGGLFPLGVVLWPDHRDRQITQLEELGLARDVQWLGASDRSWLLRTSSGALLTLESSQQR